MNAAHNSVGAGRHRATALVIVLSVLAVGTSLASGRAGPRLGSPHVVALSTGEILGLAPRPTGGVVAVGYSGQQMLVVRLEKNLARRATAAAGPGVAHAVITQPDGKIVVAGTVSPNGNGSLVGDMIVKRFDANGAADRTFGSHGSVRLRGAVANAVSLGPKGTIVAAGSIPGPDGSPRVALARLQANGSPDRSFGANGFAEIDLGPYSEANAVVVRRDGKIVFGGDQAPRLQVVNALIARLSSSGRLDRAFGHGGVYSYQHPRGGAASSFAALALDSAGRIVGGGGDVQNSGQHALVVRLRPGGSPDASFGSSGVFTAPAERNSVSGTNLGVRGLVILSGGGIIGAGGYLDSAYEYGALWALTGRGHLDTHQGSGGLVKTQLPGVLGGEALAIAQADQSVYVAGDLIGISGRKSYTARYGANGLVR